MAEHCASCRFWLDTDPNPVLEDGRPREGACRVRSAMDWPVRMSSEWCGEYRRRGVVMGEEPESEGS